MKNESVHKSQYIATEIAIRQCSTPQQRNRMYNAKFICLTSRIATIQQARATVNQLKMPVKKEKRERGYESKKKIYKGIERGKKGGAWIKKDRERTVVR